MASAATPWFVCGWRARRRSLPPSMKGDRLLPLVFAAYDDIISAPPATTTSSMPDMTGAAPKLAPVMPEPQKRSSVTPLAVTA